MVLIIDIVMLEISGLKAMQTLRHISLRVSIVLITGYAILRSAIEALRLGALDMVMKLLIVKSLRQR